MKRPLSLVFFLFILNTSEAQNKFWVSFKDKAGATFDPLLYFSERTIQQRLMNNIPLTDSTDFPVSESYIEAVSLLADSVSKCSRWLNGIAVYAREEAIAAIRELPFVISAEPMQCTAALSAEADSRIKWDLISSEDSAYLLFQTSRMEARKFIDLSLDGSGIRIAVFDAGFPGLENHKAFAHLYANNKIISTYDFVRSRSAVNAGHWHGTATLSCIAGRADTINIGLATGAEFLLAITERAISEKFSEEENWLAAAEWADKLGANIINSSLGYTHKRYFPSDMNGMKSLVARAATMAASKGILVVNAGGNDGSDSWRIINTPADADSVLAVGGTNPKTDIRIFFSSYGPARDGALKPNVCSVGEVVAARTKGLARLTGTSFSAPLVAGFAACAWQMKRSLSNMQLFEAIEKASHLYPYYDHAHGFGIPLAGKFISGEDKPEPTFDFVIVNNNIKLVLREAYSYPETESAFGFSSRRNLYYKIEDANGKIRQYYVLLAGKKEMLDFYAEDFQSGDILTAHFEGYTASLDFPELEK